MSLSRFLNSSMTERALTPPQLWLEMKSTGLTELGTAGKRRRKSSSPASIFPPVNSTWKERKTAADEVSCDADVILKSIVYVYMLFYLECDLRCEYEFVCLEQASRGVHEHRVGEAVYQILHSLTHVIGLGSSINCIVEHHTECLQEAHHSTLKCTYMYTYTLLWAVMYIHTCTYAYNCAHFQ